MSNTPNVRWHSLAETGALDLSYLTGPRHDLSGMDLIRRPFGDSGDMWAYYPFPKHRWMNLDRDTSDPKLATCVKTRLDGLIEALVELGGSVGLSTFSCELILTELITNGTQYGSFEAVPLFRLRWKVDQTDPSLEIKLSQPTERVFDIGEHSVTTVEQWNNSSSDDEKNGHVGVGLLANLCRHLKYIWELKDGRRLVCSLVPVEDPSRTCPIGITAQMFRDGFEEPYSYEQLKSDLAAEGSLLATTVTVSCVIGRPDSVSSSATTVA